MHILKRVLPRSFCTRCTWVLVSSFSLCLGKSTMGPLMFNSFCILCRLLLTFHMAFSLSDTHYTDVQESDKILSKSSYQNNTKNNFCFSHTLSGRGSHGFFYNLEIKIFWIYRNVCSSSVAHLAAVTASRVRFLSSCIYVFYIKEGKKLNLEQKELEK